MPTSYPFGAPQAGMCARRRTYFLLLRQKKVGKEKATPLAVSLRFAAGSLRCSVVGRRCGTRCALAALRSNSRSESEHEARPSFGVRARPTPCASRHGQRGRENTGHRFARPRSGQQATRLVLAPPEGRGAGQASNRRGRGLPGHWRCPLEGGGGTSRRLWSLGVCLDWGKAPQATQGGVPDPGGETSRSEWSPGVRPFTTRYTPRIPWKSACPRRRGIPCGWWRRASPGA